MSNLREQLLQSPPRKRVEVEFQGAKAELLAPTVKQRKEILKKAGSGDGTGTLLDLQTWVAIYCTVSPGTNTRVFEDTDVDVLENMATGGFLDIVGENMLALLNVEDSDVKKSEEN